MNRPLHVIARITDDRIVVLHHKQYPSLDGGQSSYATVEFRVVHNRPAQKARVR